MLIESADVSILETEIDAFEKDLPVLKNFILPGGDRAAAFLHLARTVCRRAERELAALHEQSSVRAEMLQFVNRLSDFLFVAARWVNHRQGVVDEIWKSR